MAIQNPIITINGLPIKTSELSSYKLMYSKLWKNASRDMNGDLTATLIGVYPNISLETDILNFPRAENISAAVNQDYFSVTYWDTQTSSHKTAQYYAADHQIEVLNECKYGKVTIELVAVSKSNYI